MLTVSLNGEILPPDTKVTVKRSLERGNAAWVNGRRLNPGETIELDGVIVHVEPLEEFRDITLCETGDV